MIPPSRFIVTTGPPALHRPTFPKSPSLGRDYLRSILHTFSISRPLAPDRIIAPYNYTLKNLCQRERNGWGERVIRDALSLIPRASIITSLAGNDYCDPIETKSKETGFKVIRPLKRLAIGKQQQELIRLLATSSRREAASKQDKGGNNNDCHLRASRHD